MRRFHWSAILGLAAVVLLAAASPVWAQQPPPRIGYVYPAGGRQGTSFEVVVGGQFLNNASAARLSGPGVKAAVVETVRVVNQQQFNDLRDRMQELLKTAKPGDGEAAKELADIRKKMAAFLARPTSPAIAETARLQVTVAADAAPGRRELRLATPAGLSNPLVFDVGQLPEVTKKSSQTLDNIQDLRALRSGAPPKSISSPPPINVTPPATMNGQIMPGGVDRYRFSATRGQRMVVAVQARELIPYIADAVPGWFQAAVTLFDSAGRELDHADHFRFHPDPALCYEIPRDGEYVLEIRDSLYRGREDFVYRIALGELPYVTGIFPLGGEAGAATTVELMGWNLPINRLTQDAKDQRPGVFPLSVTNKDYVSNRVLFAVDALPEVRVDATVRSDAVRRSAEQDALTGTLQARNSPAGARSDAVRRSPSEANGRPEHDLTGTLQTAQPVTLPVIVNGRVERPGEWSVFRFDGRAGDEVVAEVVARRLGSPLDSVLKLTDSAGRQLAFNDDWEDKAAALDTHHADSYLCAKLPGAGTFFVHLGDVQRQGGPEYAFRLRISAPRPDYQLRVTPSAVNVRGGGSTPLTVYALRKDGFTGEIQLALKDAPAGFRLDGGRVPAGADQVRVTLTAPLGVATRPADALTGTLQTGNSPAGARSDAVRRSSDGPASTTQPANALTGTLQTASTIHTLIIEGRAKIQGRDVTHAAVPAEDMMQAFAYRHLVPCQDLTLLADVSAARFATRVPMRILGPGPAKIAAGKSANVLVSLPPGLRAGNPQFELSDPPEGITLQQAAPAGQVTELVFKADSAKVKPGLKGNLIVNVFMPPRNPTTAPARPQNNQRRTALGTLPAIPFEVVAE